MYLWLKYLHILSATVFFGTGIGTASVMLYGHYTKNVLVMAFINNYVVKVDWLFTGVSGITQLVSGLWMASIAGYSLNWLWLKGSLIAYVITVIFWLVVVYLQIKIRAITQQAAQHNSVLPPSYYVYFKWWFLLGWPAFLSLLIIFYFMIMKPI